MQKLFLMDATFILTTERSGCLKQERLNNPGIIIICLNVSDTIRVLVVDA